MAEDRCPHVFPPPAWMNPDQDDDPCRCDLGIGHTVPHSCEHLRGEVRKTEEMIRGAKGYKR